MARVLLQAKSVLLVHYGVVIRRECGENYATTPQRRLHSADEHNTNFLIRTEFSAKKISSHIKCKWSRRLKKAYLHPSAPFKL